MLYGAMGKTRVCRQKFIPQDSGFYSTQRKEVILNSEWSRNGRVGGQGGGLSFWRPLVADSARVIIPQCMFYRICYLKCGKVWGWEWGWEEEMGRVVG